MIKITSITIILVILISIISISGCLDTSTKNQTWGEKTLSKDLIKIVNSTGEPQSFNEKNFYYVSVTLVNENTVDALKIKLLVEGFDKNGKLVGKNSTPYISSSDEETGSDGGDSTENTGTTIPAKSKATFYYLINDPDNQIVNYTVTLVNAQANFI